MKIRVRDIDINYEVYGEGMPALMIHGWGVDHRLMSGCLEPVFEKSAAAYRRYYIDLPGMGKTPATDKIGGSDDMLAYIEDFIGALFPDRDFILAGESYGGYLSRALIQRMSHRISGLLLIAPLFKPYVMTEHGMDKGDVPEHRVTYEDTAFLAELSERDRESFRFLGVHLTRDSWTRFKSDVLPGIEAADQKFLGNSLSRRVPFATDPDSPDKPYDKPALIITGRQDSAAGYRGIWTILERYPRASFAVLDGCGHNLQSERVPLFNELVADWLDRVEHYNG